MAKQEKVEDQQPRGSHSSEIGAPGESHDKTYAERGSSSTAGPGQKRGS